MEHHPLMSFEDGLEITYSDVKKNNSGMEYVTIYFEQPNERMDDFKSAQRDYPCDGFMHVAGYTQEELDKIWKHVVEAGGLAIAFPNEDKDKQ